MGDMLTGAATGDATISAVELVDPTGVELVSTYLIDVHDGVVFGSDTMPPTNPPPAWQDRVDAIGAMVPAGVDKSIVVLVKHTTDDDATASGIRVSYKIGSTEYAKLGTTEYLFRSSCF